MNFTAAHDSRRLLHLLSLPSVMNHHFGRLNDWDWMMEKRDFAGLNYCAAQYLNEKEERMENDTQSIIQYWLFSLNIHVCVHSAPSLIFEMSVSTKMIPQGVYINELNHNIYSLFSSCQILCFNEWHIWLIPEYIFDAERSCLGQQKEKTIKTWGKIGAYFHSSTKACVCTSCIQCMQYALWSLHAIHKHMYNGSLSNSIKMPSAPAFIYLYGWHLFSRSPQLRWT